MKEAKAPFSIFENAEGLINTVPLLGNITSFFYKSYERFKWNPSPLQKGVTQSCIDSKVNMLLK